MALAATGARFEQLRAVVAGAPVAMALLDGRWRYVARVPFETIDLDPRAVVEQAVRGVEEEARRKGSAC